MDSSGLLRDYEIVAEDAEEAGNSPQRRWEHLGIFVSLAVMNQASWIMYTSVPRATSRLFEVSEDTVTFLATIYPLLYVPGSILARLATRRGGLRATLRESSMVMVFGSVLKYVGAQYAHVGAQYAHVGPRAGFAATVVGQVAMGLVQPYILNSPVALGTDWFPRSERDLASTMAFLGNILGQALGEALSPLVVEWSSLSFLCLIMLCPNTLCCLWTVTRYENNNVKAPPPQQHGRSLVLSEWTQLLRWQEKHFIVLFAAFCFGGSVFNTLLAIAAQWLAPCGYSSSQVGFMTSTFVLVGVPSAALVGFALDKTRAYRTFVRALSIAALLATLFLFVAARRNDVVFLYAAFAALGAAVIAVSAAVLEAAVECTYPKSPELSTGLLFCGSNTLTIPVSYVFQALLRMQKGRCLPLTSLNPLPSVAIFTASSLAVSSILLLSYSGPYRRLEAEQQYENNGATPATP